MRDDIVDYKDYYFAVQSNQTDKDYYYLWCSVDSLYHVHMDFYELLIVASGTPVHYYQGKEKILYKNSVYFFKPGESHRLWTEPFQAVHFSLIMKETFVERFLEKHTMFEEVLKNASFSSCELTDDEFDGIYDMLSSLSCGDENYNVSKVLYSAFQYLIKHNSVAQKKIIEDYVDDLCKKLNEKEYLVMKIQDLYKMYPVAQSILIREFKKSTGDTIVRYQKKRKLAYAAKLLRSSEYQVTEISEILEYKSLSHFFHVFKDEYGVTPREYRKSQVV